MDEVAGLQSVAGGRRVAILGRRGFRNARLSSADRAAPSAIAASAGRGESAAPLRPVGPTAARAHTTLRAADVATPARFTRAATPSQPHGVHNARNAPPRRPRFSRPTPERSTACFDCNLKAAIETVRRAARGMEAGAAADEFITIVPVGEGKPAVKDSAFVTVLTVGAAAGAAEIVVQRPRGARLGLGLKFEGGSAAAEKVRRLLVQSCAEDSPAANACSPWGKLIPGDEILAIDGVSVSDLTRIDCVRRLKDSDETLKLLVRHFEINEKPELNIMDSVEESLTLNQTSEICAQTTLPPPVPPRKLGKKNSFKDKQTLQTVGEQNALENLDGHKQTINDKDNLGTIQSSVVSTTTKLSRKSSFDSHIHRQNKEGIAYLKKGSPDEVRRLVRRLSDGKVMPPDAEVYIDLLSNEWERCLVMADAESDDTGSSISTVVDRLGSMASSVENSIPSTPIMQPKSFDIHKVLNCIENIDSNILKDMTNGTFIENEIALKREFKKLESNTNEFSIQENFIQNTPKEDSIPSSKKQHHNNDKNNNYTVALNPPKKLEASESQNKEQKDTKQEVATDKPKPMPRNTKIERSASEKKRKPIPIPETLPPPALEPLLTPTKKTCIETWLQRSEAEMNNKTDDKFDESIAPEVLPRLIDFVPKSQFKENANETQVCTRPTTAPPPPPPVETREDGSGASLDTIGEMDESGDVTDSAKGVKKNETKTRKSSFERNFWEDRIPKSDAEDKSLSNDETPLPTCPRQPPDGVETPSDAIDKAPDLPSRLPPRLPPAWSDVVDNIKAPYRKPQQIPSNKQALSDRNESNSVNESKISTSVIRLIKGVGAGVGLILAGGIDCEAKDVTVHRVLADSVAAKAGLKRGAKVRSINGYTMTGLTHAQSVAILKEQRSEVDIEIENEIVTNDNVSEYGSENAESKDRRKKDEIKVDDDKANINSGVVTVILEKAGGGTGLGFGLDGGRDSPHGDRPLTIKKLFAGGAAAQSGRILVGAELVSAGGQSMETFTRTQAWAALKSLPVGPVTLVLRNPK
ncbi:unnamed protein product, partial [Iphiclides podalirius]